MAGEIGHVVYAARVQAHLGEAVTDHEYWIGTLLPNIYQLNMGLRHATHPARVSLASLVGESDFMTGVRTHAWIDTTRLHYLQRHNMKEVLPWHPYVPLAFKLFEDDLLYDHFEDWNLLYRLLNTLHRDEQVYAGDDAVLRQWHTILQHYLRTAPTDATRERLVRSLGISESGAAEVLAIKHELGRTDAARDLLFGFWRHLEDLLN